MNKITSIIPYALFIVAMLTACTGKQGQTTEDKDAPVKYYWRADTLPDLRVSGDEGVAGAVIAIIDGRLTVWGGANFPERPAAEGGKKRVWGNVYTLTEDGWERQPDRTPLAYAATTPTPYGLAIAGGNDGNSPLRDADFWGNGGKGFLPHLPYKVENAAMAYGDGKLFLIGGQTSKGPSRGAFCLPLPYTRYSVPDIAIPNPEDNPEGYERAMRITSPWKSIPALPRSPRVQCSAAWLDGRLYVAGGYDPTDGTVNGTIFSWAPGDSTWTFVDSLRKPGELQTWTLVGGTMLADTVTHRLLFVGGVDATIFQEAISRPMRLAEARERGNTTMTEMLEREAAEYMHHEPSWYRFNDELISYDPKTQEYRHELSHPSLARAGAAVLMHDSVIYVVNGELKPGIRSHTAVRLTRRIVP